MINILKSWNITEETYTFLSADINSQSKVINISDSLEWELLKKSKAVLSNPFSAITGEPVQYKSMQIEINFENPLSEALTNCTLTVTASGLFRGTAKATVAAVGPDQILRVLIPCSPYKHGEKRVVADFDCDQFRDIKASRNIIIKPSGTPLP
ncbi:hypothetical protein GJAV_G00181170 [Gymnothorax javanicus]|nr:hypothetical protein GJAV_G00181170 [Gymnothorax javanicus]